MYDNVYICGGMSMNEFIGGCKKGMPIALGYFPVAFSFGVLVASSGLPLGLATLISLTNLTSSGQFAGISLILANASYLEIAATLLMINARYFLMSLSLSQKIDQNMNTLQRMIISFGITDETFGIASIQPGNIDFSFYAWIYFAANYWMDKWNFSGGNFNECITASIAECYGDCVIWNVFSHYYSSFRKIKSYFRSGYDKCFCFNYLLLCVFL